MKPRLVQSWPLRPKPRLDVDPYTGWVSGRGLVDYQREVLLNFERVKSERLASRLADDPPSLWQAMLFGGCFAAIVIGFSLLILGG